MSNRIKHKNSNKVNLESDSKSYSDRKIKIQGHKTKLKDHKSKPNLLL